MTVSLAVALAAGSLFAVDNENYAKDIRVDEWQAVTNPPAKRGK